MEEKERGMEGRGGSIHKEEVKQMKKGVEKRKSTCSDHTGWHRSHGTRDAGRMKVKWSLGSPRPNIPLPSPLPS